MHIVELIARKRDGGALTPEEIAFIVEGYTAGTVPDYQVSAFLMAVMFRGMTDEESGALTETMLESGTILDLSDLGRPVSDKHSTGGVGDKTSLLIAPMAASAGLAVPMISGRALGHTGGTLDKLESIPGFRTDLTLERFRALLEEYGMGLIGQTAEIAPADRRIYALRDATATVPSIPLIVASIMSKKLAEGLDALVLDVKVGSGAFMKTVEDARTLATTMCSVGERRGTRCAALLTRMEEPLGRAVGNGVEVVECVEALRGGGPADMVDLSVELTAWMLLLGGLAPDVASGREAARAELSSGRALERFGQIVEAQGGDRRVLDDTSLLPRAPAEAVAKAPRGGFVAAVDTEAVGWAIMAMGAGRSEAGGMIDPGAGLLVEAKIGDEVREGDSLGLLLARDAETAERTARRVAAAFTIGEERPAARSLVLETVEGRSDG